ncbi:hypothetical protein CC117_30235 [Parafrankia colletiae]|uniref:VWFA domain-containing protein n=1 Tax=Parafrankia colletiae TaxID=573497 RepID=A0A1S1Q8U6_9ACTN|nr:vWA domain-containing protein [Parafrankia colletiae]MCK9904175.1 VWA domain-containing protein [Frankia sp. Cpl3]OHV28634.1 hypothetical protein CC117_30235 [Parafrankia colletiae]
MALYQGNLQYAVDIVMCIDVTGSMGPVIDRVKENALSFHAHLDAAMGRKGKSTSQLRIKVIAFRDFGYNTQDAIQESEFYVLPDESAGFERFVKGLVATGGGDEPESALEALALALQSSWERGMDRRRHVVVMFTDASAHPLGSPSAVAAPSYPQHIARNLEELSEQWGYATSQSAVMENSAKRLVLFAPERPPWPDLAEEWNWTIYFPSRAGAGLEEYELDEIVDTIAHSL